MGCIIPDHCLYIYSEEETLEGWSLMYTRNRRGPITVSSGTADVAVAGEDVFPFRTIC